MNKIILTSRIGLMLFSFLAGAPSVCHAVEIDRVLAAVNGRVLTEGDLVLARNLDALMHPGSTGGPPGNQTEIDRLIDLELLRQEMEGFMGVTEGDAQTGARMEELRRSYDAKGGLDPVLIRLGLLEREVEAYLLLQVDVMRFIDFRFRPFVQVTAQEIEKRYTEQFVPELHRAGSTVPPLAEVFSRIEGIIMEEKINDSMEQWIREIRSRAVVEFLAEQAP